MKCLKNRSIKKSIKQTTYAENSNKLAIIVGHTKKSPGAYCNTLGVYERDYNEVFAEIIKRDYQRAGGHCEIFFRDNIGIHQAYLDAVSFEPKVILELHFNAGGGVGCEVLYSDVEDKKGIYEKQLAEKVNQAMYEVLKVKKRSEKRRAKQGERGFYNLSRVSSVPSLILEPFFGDNDADSRNFDLKKEKLSQEIVKVIRSYKPIS